MKKDVISKEILKAIVEDIAKYILKISIDNIEFVDAEKLRVESRRADIVAIVNNSFVLHLEVQNNNDKTMPYRMLRYWLDIKKDIRLPVKQYVIYIGKEKLSMKSNLLEDNVNYYYNLIDMKNIDCDLFLKEDTPDALVLAILCDFKDKNPKDVISYIIERLKYHTKDNLQEFRKYLIMLEELSENRNLQELIKEQEMLSEIKLEKLPSYEIGYERGEERGMQKGVQKGIQKGIQKAIKGIYVYEKNPKKIAQLLEVDEKFVLKVLNENKS